MSYFVVGRLHGAEHYTVYAVLKNGHVRTQISKPDGIEIDPPAGWQKLKHMKKKDVQIRSINAQTFVHTKANGEQPRKPVWRRAGRTAAAQ